MQSTHETNSHSKNVNAIYEQYNGYVKFSKDDPALSQEVNSIPVWWDMEK